MSTNRNNDLSMQHFACDGTYALELNTRRLRTLSSYLRFACGVLTLALSASLVAQTHFCIGGDLDHLGPAAVAACRSKMTAVRSAVIQHGAPADWHFVVVCDEAGWKDYASFSGKAAGNITEASYSTDSQLRWTFLRGSELDPARPQETASLLAAALKSAPVRRDPPRLAPADRASRRLNIATANSPSTPPLEQ